MIRRKKAQSILEYVIILGAVVLAVIAATSGPNAPIKQAVEKMFSDSANLIEDKTDDFLTRAGSSGGGD